MSSDQVESLYGRLNLAEMGQRAFRETAPTAKSTERTSLPVKPKSKPSMDASLGEWAGIQYRPRTAQSKQAWPLLLSFTSALLEGDGSHEVIVSAADIILDCLAEREGETEQLRHSVSQALGQEVPLERFIPLLTLCRRFNDYRRREQEVAQEDQVPFEGEEEGVAVVFAEDDEEEEEQEEEDDAPVKVDLSSKETMKLDEEPAIIHFGDKQRYCVISLISLVMPWMKLPLKLFTS